MSRSEAVVPSEVDIARIGEQIDRTSDGVVHHRAIIG